MAELVTVFLENFISQLSAGRIRKLNFPLISNYSNCRIIFDIFGNPDGYQKRNEEIRLDSCDLALRILYSKPFHLTTATPCDRDSKICSKALPLMILKKNMMRMAACRELVEPVFSQGLTIVKSMDSVNHFGRDVNPYQLTAIGARADFQLSVRYARSDPFQRVLRQSLQQHV